MIKIGVIIGKGGAGKSTIVKAIEKRFKERGSSVQIVDLDPQKTLTTIARIAGDDLPVEPRQATADIIIYDTPPYHDERMRSLISDLDHIIIPTKAGYPDLASATGIYKDLKARNAFKKAIILINEVRKPVDSTHKEIRDLLKKNYPRVKLANTELSNLKGFKNIFLNHKGSDYKKAMAQIDDFLKEINLTNI